MVKWGISKKDLKICKLFTGFYKFYITHIIDVIIESRIEKLRDITVKKVSQLTFDKQVKYHNNLKQKSNRNEIEEFELEVLNSLF